MKNNDEYVPGVCNIGKEEIKMRRNAAIFGLALSILVASLLLLTHADILWRFVIFFPLVSLGIGFQQWYFKFCVRFGMKGLFNFKDAGQTISIEDAEMRRLDKAKAVKMIVIGILFGLTITILFYLIP